MTRKYYWSPEKNRDTPALYNLREVANLSEINADVDWQTFLDGAGLGDRAEIVVAQMSYFESMGEILNGFSIDAWKDYLKFHALNGAATFLSSEFEDADFAFNGKLLGGLEEKTPRWKNAVPVAQKRPSRFLHNRPTTTQASPCRTHPIPTEPNECRYAIP